MHATIKAYDATVAAMHARPQQLRRGSIHAISPCHLLYLDGRRVDSLL